MAINLGGDYPNQDSATGIGWRVEDTPSATLCTFEASGNIMTQPLDWLLHLLGWPIRVRVLTSSEATVHWGFWIRWQGVREAVRAGLKKDKPVIFIGFSLGGAIAQCAFLDLLVQYPAVTCLTAGAPKIWYKMPPLIALPIRNYINGNDAVAKLPPWGKRLYSSVRFGEKWKFWKFSGKQHDCGAYEKEMKNEPF